jgi:hypothetical protein
MTHLPVVFQTALMARLAATSHSRFLLDGRAAVESIVKAAIDLHRRSSGPSSNLDRVLPVKGLTARVRDASVLILVCAGQRPVKRAAVGLGRRLVVAWLSSGWLPVRGDGAPGFACRIRSARWRRVSPVRGWSKGSRSCSVISWQLRSASHRLREPVQRVAEVLRRVRDGGSAGGRRQAWRGRHWRLLSAGNTEVDSRWN